MGISRERSLRQRLIEKGSFVSTPASSPNKPLPCAPNSLATAIFSKPTERYRLTQKSVPNLKAARENDKRNADIKPPGRAMSVNGAAGGPDSENFVLKLRRLSRARLRTKESASENPDADRPIARPSTAPSRASRARSISLEPLKSLHKNRKRENQRAQATMVAAQADWSTVSQTSVRRETMKSQLLQYFKSDRVIEAWEDAAQKEKKNNRQFSQVQKDGPWSKFCAESSTINAGGTLHLKTDMVESTSNRDIAWLQEDAGGMNTYSLKPKRDVDPRIHVLSVQFSRGQDGNAAGDPGSEADLVGAAPGESQSAITAYTALPSMPAPLGNREDLHHQTGSAGAFYDAM